MKKMKRKNESVQKNKMREREREKIGGHVNKVLIFFLFVR